MAMAMQEPNMLPQTPGRYHEKSVEISADPLALMSRLVAAGPHDDYAVYENHGQWSFAGGVLAEICLDRSGARMRCGGGTASLPWEGPPLRQVRRLLGRVPAAGWRAYGWAAFELAYAKDGDASRIGSGQRLLYLMVPRTEVRLREGRALVRSVDEDELRAVATVLSGNPPAGRWEPSPVDVRKEGAEGYERAVELAVGEINSRKLQKVILSRTVTLPGRIDFVGTYVAGRRGNTPARSFLLRLGGIESAGFSPEIVVGVSSGGRVVIQPLAGTRALTRDPAHNGRLRDELLTDSKEIYEHAISVKAACDDLRAVCRPDSLTVEEFMTVIERGSVQHLASRVAGELAEGHDAWDAFAAAFPAVTASGVPRDAACASIRAHEANGRGLYSGAVLIAGDDGAMDAALVLRAVYRVQGRTWLQAGAGIVGQSTPVREFEETCEKLDSVARFLVPAGEAAEPPGARPGLPAAAANAPRTPVP
jgi:salicylate synthetase